NGAKRQRDTKTFPEGSGRAAIAASNCRGVNRPSSLPASGSGAEFLKRLPESAAAVNANANTTRTIPKNLFIGPPFQDSLRGRDEFGSTEIDILSCREGLFLLLVSLSFVLYLFLRFYVLLLMIC